MFAVELLVLAGCVVIAVLCFRILKTLEAIRDNTGKLAPMAYIDHCKEMSDISTENHKPVDPLAPLTEACHSIAAAYNLSRREEEVLSYFARGKSHVAIAEELHIGSATVKTHSSNIYQKLNIHSRDELIDLVEKRLTAPNERCTGNTMNTATIHSRLNPLLSP